MALSVVVLMGWFGHILICYYLIRPIHHTLTRIILIFLPCLLLCYKSCLNLPQFDRYSIITVAFCWLTSIRLIGLIGVSRNKLLTFQSYLLKIVWIYFPVLPSKSEKNQWSIKFYLILIVVKFLFNHWIYRWCLICQLRVNYEKIFLFYISITTISFMYDLEIVLVRILTRGQYTLESFTNFPLFSLSLREFWGQRYNRLIGTVLKESIFEPIRSEFSSQLIGALTTFIVSGLFHVHIAFVAFDDISHLFPTFMFFLIHGIACCLEANITIQFSEYIGWLITHTFLLLTAPMVLEPFINKGFPFFVVHPPPLFHIEWLPKLPVPNFCLR
jgi:hypothetical protein